MSKIVTSLFPFLCIAPLHRKHLQYFWYLSLKGLPETSVMSIWNMEMAILSHIITLVVSVDTGEHLPSFEGVWGCADPIWGELGGENPQNQWFFKVFQR